MSYEVNIDGKTLYFPSDAEYAIYDSILKLQLNDSGTFECAVPPTNPEYANIKNRKSMIQILKNNKEIFCGEVRECEKDFYRAKQVYAVGELAFLFDSIQPQAKYQDKTARQLLEIWLAEHNRQTEEKKHFYVGMVTVHDKNDSLYRFTNQETTLDCIRQKLCEKLGGYLRIRKENGKRYLDLITLQEYGKVCEQPIEFGENLLDYAESTTANELYTCVIPKGARLEKSPIEGLEAYVDIKLVNNGKDYLYSPEAVATYGWNRCVVSWDDVTLPENLKRKGEQWLKDNQFETLTLNLTAADLSLLDVDMESFELGDYIPVYSSPHGMDRTFPVQSLELHLQNPAEDKLQLGNTLKKDYLQENQGKFNAVEQELENNRQTTSFLQSAIDNATNMMTGSKGGYKVSEYDEKGRWLRDLYMNTPSKETATQIMQINMNGIGFSRSGFEGPYKNAWTIDGVLLGEFIKAGSVSTEKLSVEYRESVSNEINSVATSKFNVAKGLIEAEVTRASKAEEDLRAYIRVTSEAIDAEVTRATAAEQKLKESLAETDKNLGDFKTEIDTTFKDGVISEAEAEAIEKYLNIIQTDYDSVVKQCDAILSSIQKHGESGSRLKITFHKDCKTETSGSGTKYDYLQLYYVKDGNTLRYQDKLSGADIAGKSFILPEPEFYLYWHTDSFNTGNKEYYGFSVDALERCIEEPNVSGMIKSIPDIPFADTKSKEVLSTSHPYGHSEDKLWHYKDTGISQITITNKINAFKNAYNALKDYITNAIADKKATETEIAEVNKRFATYNTALSELKETIHLAQLDAALGAAGGVAEYARANLKVTADQIKAEVERATQEEGRLKSSLEIQAGLIESKVETNEIASYIQQYYDRVLIGFNNSSKYVQITAGKIAIYDNGIIDSKKRAVFDQNGNRFYRDGYYVGMIGTNVLKNNESHKGLMFGLEYEGKYMSWSHQKSVGAGIYTMIWTYSRANSAYGYEGLHAGTDIYMNSYNIYLRRDQSCQILPYVNGIGIRSNQNIYFEIGSAETKVNIDYSALHVYNGLQVYNNTNCDFYTDLDMHNYSIYNQSDERLKEKIRPPEESALEKLLQLNILQYDWRETKEHVNMGVIAQQVEQIIPEAVKVSDKTGLYSVNLIALIPYLVKALQELIQMDTRALPDVYIPKKYTQIEIEQALQAAKPPSLKVPIEEEPLVVKIDKEEKCYETGKQRSKAGKKTKARNRKNNRI